MVSATTKENVNEALQRSWEVSPTTVYGLLIGLQLLLILALVAALIIVWRSDNRTKASFQVLLKEVVLVITTFTEKFDGDGRELADEKLKSTLRGVVQAELQPISKRLHALEKN